MRLLSARIKILIFTIPILFLVNSCQDDAIVDIDDQPKDILLMTQHEQFDFVEDNLKVIAKGVLGVARDQSFRNILYDEIDIHSAGDNNVLFRRLEVVCAEDNVKLKQQMQAFLRTNSTEGEIDQAIGVFENINGETYYPQIYIPFYEERKQKNGFSRNTESDPVIVVYNGDETVTEFPGYTLDDNDELVETGFNVDEGYAQENEVWVVGLSEYVVCDPTLPTLEECGIEGGGGENSNNHWEDGLISQLQVFDLKESWVAGAAEVSIVTFSTWPSGINPNTGLQNDIHWVGDPDFRQIDKVRRSESGDLMNIEFNMYDNWNPPNEPNPQGSVGNELYFVIFEHDSWPAAFHDPLISGTNFSLRLGYRSSNSPYDMGVYTFDQLDASEGERFSFTTGGIFWSGVR